MKTRDERPDPDEPDLEARTIARLLRALARVRVAAQPFIREASTLTSQSLQPTARVTFTLAQLRALVDAIPQEES